MSKKGQLFIISGPSGAGEDSVIEGLRKFFDLERVITTTTRPKRPGESQGNPYYFISRKEFEHKIKKGEFIEYAEAYNKNLYGTTKQELKRIKNSGKIGIWKIEFKGVEIIKNKYPEIKAIFIAPPSLAILRKRILKRDSVGKKYLETRMNYTKEWLRHKSLYDYQVVNHEGKLAQTILAVKKIIEGSL